MDNDNSWTNILYILAIAAFGLIKAFVKKKAGKTPVKPVQSEDTSSQSTKMQDVLENLFGDVFSEESQHEEEVDLEPISEIFVEEPKVEEKITEERKPITRIDVQELSFDDSNQNNFSDEEEFEDVDFDLKQAVINSEILNRKYC